MGSFGNILNIRAGRISPVRQIGPTRWVGYKRVKNERLSDRIHTGAGSRNQLRGDVKIASDTVVGSRHRRHKTVGEDLLRQDAFGSGARRFGLRQHSEFVILIRTLDSRPVEVAVGVFLAQTK
jgi:hypothetical protein